MARRSALGTEQSAAAIRALEFGCTRDAAAGAAGVTRSTFYRWLDDGTFRDAVEKAELKAEAAYTLAVQQAVPKNWQAAAWWLERRRHESFGRRDRVDMTIDLRKEAERVAAESGMDVDAVLAEAQAIVDGK